MNKKTMKLISVLWVAIMSVFCITSICFAADINPSSINGKANVDVSKVQNIGNQIATIIRNVGIVAAVIIIMVLGIKYMLGSAEEKAEYKKVFIPYIIGAVLLFGASAIAQAIITFSNGITATDSQLAQTVITFSKMIIG